MPCSQQRLKSMNIIFTFAQSDYTGASRMGHSFMRALRNRGHGVFAVIGPFNGNGEKRLADALSADNFEFLEADIFNSFWRYQNVTKLKSIIIDQAPDCLVSINQNDVKVSAIAARQLSLPYIPVVQNLRFFHGNYIFRKIKSIIYEKLMQTAARVVCVSVATAVEHKKRFGICNSMLSIVPASIDFKAVKQSAKRTERSVKRVELNLSKDDIILVNTGRISPQKGHKVLLEALHKTPFFFTNTNVHMLIIGSQSNQDDRYSKDLYDALKDSPLNERIHFLGWRDDVPEILAACDFYIHSALWEGPPLPLAVLEAMACGLGVVMTDCAGRLPNFVEGQHGWCVAKNDPEALAEGIQQVLKLDEVERAEMGRAARELAVSHFDIKVNGARFVDEIEKAASEYAAFRK